MCAVSKILYFDQTNTSNICKYVQFLTDQTLKTLPYCFNCEIRIVEGLYAQKIAEEPDQHFPGQPRQHRPPPYPYLSSRQGSPFNLVFIPVQSRFGGNFPFASRIRLVDNFFFFTSRKEVERSRGEN